MGKLCTDQLADKLVPLFRDADPDKFDEAVEKTKTRLGAETKQAHRDDLEKLFDSQIAILTDRGTSEQILEVLQNQKSVVVLKASEMTIGERNIPFLPVIKPAYLGYYGLMAMVRNGSKEGYTYLKPTAVTDQFDTPNDLYYIYDVEDGETMRGKSPEAAEKIFKKQSRFPLTAAEIINLCILTDVLSRHYVWGSGSRRGSADRVSSVWLEVGRPVLDWGFADGSGSEWGSPSLGSR